MKYLLFLLFFSLSANPFEIDLEISQIKRCLVERMTCLILIHDREKIREIHQEIGILFARKNYLLSLQGSYGQKNNPR